MRKRIEPLDTPSARTLEKAIQEFGTQAELAEKLGVTQQYISRARKMGWVSGEVAKAIEVVTNGKIKRHECRPDLFDAPVHTEIRP